MRKTGLIMLLVMLLSFSALVAAENPSGFSYSLENILTVQEEVIDYGVSIVIYENEAFLAYFSEQEFALSMDNERPADIGLEMGNYLVGSSLNTNIDGSREGFLHFAVMG